MKQRSGFVLSGVLAILVLLGCRGPTGMYTVSYNGNGNTGGTVPIDATKYQQGQEVTVLGNTGTLVNGSESFGGWNTLADGEGTSYVAGETFTMGGGDVTLYAIWTSAPTYAVTYNGNGSTGGAVPVDPTAYSLGQTVTVLGNTGSLTKTNYAFSGWNTSADGGGTTYSPGQTFTMAAADVTLYANWMQQPVLLRAGIFYRGGTSQTVSAGTGLTINVPAEVVNGDFMLLLLNTNGSTSSHTTPAGWTPLPVNGLNWNAAGLGVKVASCWYRVASSEPGDYTLSWTTPNDAAAVMVAYSNVDLTTPLDGVDDVGFAGAAPSASPKTDNVTNVTTTSDLAKSVDLTFDSATVAGTTTWTNPATGGAESTIRIQVGPAINATAMVADYTQPSAGAVPAQSYTATGSGSIQLFGYSVSLRSAFQPISYIPAFHSAVFNYGTVSSTIEATGGAALQPGDVIFVLETSDLSCPITSITSSSGTLTFFHVLSLPDILHNNNFDLWAAYVGPAGIAMGEVFTCNLAGGAVGHGMALHAWRGANRVGAFGGEWANADWTPPAPDNGTSGPLNVSTPNAKLVAFQFISAGGGMGTQQNVEGTGFTKLFQDQEEGAFNAPGTGRAPWITTDKQLSTAGNYSITATDNKQGGANFAAIWGVVLE